MRKVLLGVSLATALFAGKYDLGLGVGRHHIDNSNLGNYNFFNLRIGKYLPKNHILRAELERSGDFSNSNEHLTRALINVEHYFDLENEKLKPYAFVGVGYQWVSGNYDNNLISDLGVGIKYFLDDEVNLFGEFRALRDFGNNDNHYGFILGVRYSFSTDEKKVIKEEIKKNVVDSDKDGVEDSKDKCLNTPQGVKVDNKGCPLDSDKDGVADYLDNCPNTPQGIKVDANGCPLDSDKDGVADYLDKCPGTMLGVKVDVNGCPLDSDKDGVADYLDKCPNTPKDIKVNEEGCPVSFNFDVRFENNSDKISPSSMDRIKEFAQFLKANPKYKAEIQGYTDSKGSAAYNLKLSTKRAKAVYEALISLGVDKNRLSYKGYGEANPIASNDTEEGKAKNRRVVAKIYY